MNLLITQSRGSGCHRRGGHTKEDCLVLVTSINVILSQMAAVSTFSAFAPPYWQTSQSLVPQPTQKGMQWASAELSHSILREEPGHQPGPVTSILNLQQEILACSPSGNTDDDSSHKLWDHQVEEVKEQKKTVAVTRMTTCQHCVLENWIIPSCIRFSISRSGKKPTAPV